MRTSSAKTEIKAVGRSGQISLGKSYAGKLLQLERQADGGIVLTPVTVVPESQLWTLEEPHRTAIAEGMAWAARTPPAETDLDALAQRAKTGRRSSRGSAR